MPVQQQQQRRRQQQRGGSVASDAVTSLVDAKTFDRMSGLFTNKVGGCGCNRSKSGGSFGALMGSSTMEAFYNNVKPPMTQAMNTGPQLLALTTPKATNSKAANASTKPTNVGKTSSVNASMVKTNVNASAPNVKQINTSSKVAANAGVKTGGNSFPTMSDIMGLYSGKNSAAMNVRHKQGGRRQQQQQQQQRQQQQQQGGWSQNTIGQSVNMQTMSYSPRTSVTPSATSILASESIISSQPMNKVTSFGSTSDQRSQPFSFGAASPLSGAGTLNTWRKKALKKLKSLKDTITPKDKPKPKPKAKKPAASPKKK